MNLRKLKTVASICIVDHGSQVLGRALEWKVVEVSLSSGINSGTGVDLPIHRW